MKYLIQTTAISAVLLTGCAAKFTPQELANADYGTPPLKAKEQVQALITTKLIDPTAPLFTFTEPVKYGLAPNYFLDSAKVFGYRVCGTVNSKNRMGGYSGPLPFIAMLRNNAVAYLKVGEYVGTDMYDISYVNKAIADNCR